MFFLLFAPLLEYCYFHAAFVIAPLVLYCLSVIPFSLTQAVHFCSVYHTFSFLSSLIHSFSTQLSATGVKKCEI